MSYVIAVLLFFILLALCIIMGQLNEIGVNVISIYRKEFTPKQVKKIVEEFHA